MLLRLLFGRESNSYNGPAPTKAERQDARHWIAEFLEDYPKSGLAADYPDLAHQAAINKRYKALEARREAGDIDEIDYMIELDKISQEVDISELTPLPTNPQRYF